MLKQVVCGVLAALSSAGLASAQSREAQKWDGPFVETATPVVSGNFADLPDVESFVVPKCPGAERRKPSWMKPAPGWDDQASPIDPLAAVGVNGREPTPAATLNFQGQSNACGCSPPDTVGAAGATQFVQMVNSTSMTVYNKSTGAVISGPSEFRLLWPSGNCRNSTDGDPIVVWDALASRWVLAQFSTGNGFCVAVSQTSSATGAYNLYEFTTPSFPDYFKIGAWSDAYYVGANESSYSALALNRSAMLSGAAASMIRFTATAPENFLLPASVAGATAPPAGTPGIFYTFKDDSFHGSGADRLEFWHFAPNFTTPASSTFTLGATLNTTAYTYTVCGFFTLNCIPQGGTAQKVDPVSEWPMWQLQYRNLGAGGQKLVANFTIDVGSDRAGIRWYEINKTGASTYAIANEGTHAPADGRHRWMGSIAMDKIGNIALGYNASSASEAPSLRYATRGPGDPAGTLQTEAVLQSGGGSQTSSNRWGDYSAMTVDPTDDCTFWFTGEYYSANGGNSWTTRIGKFVLPSCLVPVELQQLDIQ